MSDLFAVAGRTHTFSIPIRCTSNSTLLSIHWRQKHRIKEREKLVIVYFAGKAGIPRAEGKRRVGQRVTLAKGQRPFDDDNAWKVLLDGLKDAGMLIDDRPKYCETTRPEYERGETPRTVVTLTDLY